MRAFLVRLPSRRYWTVVVHDTYRGGGGGWVSAASAPGSGRCGEDDEGLCRSAAAGVSRRHDGRRLIVWAGSSPGWKHTPADADLGVKDVRSAGRINRILAVVRGFLRHGVVTGEVPGEVLFHHISHDAHLPVFRTRGARTLPCVMVARPLSAIGD